MLSSLRRAHCGARLCLLLLALATLLLAYLPPRPAAAISSLIISEIDADQSGVDSWEFVELSGPPDASLEGYRLVFFSAGSSSYPAYRVVRLDGHSVGARGRFVVGSALVDSVALIAWETGGIQNGLGAPDAVALYRDDAAPRSPTPAGLVDVVVYGDRDDPAFRERFGSPSPRLQAVDGATSALGRGADGAFRSDWPPSPGFANAPVRLNEIGQDGAVELLGTRGTPLEAFSVASYDGAGRMVATTSLSGTLPTGGPFPGGLLISAAPAVSPPAGEARLVALTAGTAPATLDAASLVDGVLLGIAESPAGRLLALPAHPPPGTGLTLGRWAAGGAGFGPTSPTPGEPNRPPSLMSLAIGTLRGPTRAPDGCTRPPRWIGRSVRLAATVTALIRDGSQIHATIQDAGDGDPATSDALLISGLSAGAVAVGDGLVVVGVVGMHDGQVALNGVTIESRQPGAAVPDPVALPDGPISACDWARLAAMRVVVPVGSTAVAPTIVLGSGDSFVDLLTPAVGQPADRRVFGPLHPAAGAPVEAIVRLTAQALRPVDPAAALPSIRTFDTLGGPAIGVVTVLADRPAIAVEALPQFQPGPSPDLNEPPPSGPLRIATINLQNFFDRLDDPADKEDNPGAPHIPLTMQRYRDRLTKTAALILDRLSAPDALVIQEAEDQDLCHGGGQLTGRCGTTDGADGILDVLHDLVQVIAIRSGGAVEYRSAVDRSGVDPRGIVTAILYRPDRLNPMTAPVAPNVRADPIVEADGEGAALFSRPPLVMRFDLGGERLTLIGVHFKSDPDDFRTRRSTQAAFTAELARAAAMAGDLVAIAGDFNDVAASPVLAPLRVALPGGTLSAALDRSTAASRYSYVFGGVAEDIDQIHLSPALAARLVDARVLHLNADWPDSAALDPSTPYRVSDHDPVVATFGPFARYEAFMPLAGK